MKHTSYEMKTNILLTLFLCVSNCWCMLAPWTKWCGDGNSAKSYFDLGWASLTDMCCRAHDFCDDYIAGGEYKHGLYNPSSYFRMACSCDDEFHSCLINAKRYDSFIARLVAVAYFDILDRKCFKKEHPAWCVRKGGRVRDDKCVKYEFLTWYQKRYQWFDVQDY